MTHRDDIQLITDVRGGAADAFDILYRRHHRAAVHAAGAEADNPSDRDDAVADAFVSVFEALRFGKGPDRAFRPYLLTAVRRIAQQKNRQATRVPVIAGPADEPSVYDEDTLTAAFNSAAMVKAFNSLSRRWQLALWYVDIKGLKPRIAAPLLELSPNALSALVLRAREGLRLAYIQAHVPAPHETECEKFSHRLGAYTRNSLTNAAWGMVHNHVSSCASCAATLAHLNDVQAGMTTRFTRQAENRSL